MPTTAYACIMMWLSRIQCTVCFFISLFQNKKYQLLDKYSILKQWMCSMDGLVCESYF